MAEEDFKEWGIVLDNFHHFQRRNKHSHQESKDGRELNTKKIVQNHANHPVVTMLFFCGFLRFVQTMNYIWSHHTQPIMSKYNVTATRSEGKLRQVSFKIKKDEVQMDFDHSNNSLVLKIAGKIFVIYPEALPENVNYKDDKDQVYSAVVLKEGVSSRTDTKEKNVILDGNQKFKIGHCAIETNDDKVLYNGKWYEDGQELTIGGRTAVIKKTNLL